MILRGILINVIFAAAIVIVPDGLIRGLLLFAWLPSFLWMMRE